MYFAQFVFIKNEANENFYFLSTSVSLNLDARFFSSIKTMKNKIKKKLLRLFVPLPFFSQAEGRKERRIVEMEQIMK